MDGALIPIWRAARYNQHLHRALAARYHKRELWSAAIVAVLGPPAVIAALVTTGSLALMAGVLTGAIMVTAGLLMRWSTLHNAYATGLVAWHDVEYLCEGFSTKAAQEAVKVALRLDPPSEPQGLSQLKTDAWQAASADVPKETLAAAEPSWPSTGA